MRTCQQRINKFFPPSMDSTKTLGDHSYRCLNTVSLSNRYLSVLGREKDFLDFLSCCLLIVSSELFGYCCLRSNVKTGSSLLIKKLFNDYPAIVTNLLNLNSSHVVSYQFQHHLSAQLGPSFSGRSS